VQEGEPERGFDRRSAEVALHAGENRGEPDELPVGMQAEDRIGQRGAAVGRREAIPQPRADVVGADVAPRALDVLRAGLDRLVLRAVLLVAAELAAVVDPRRLLRLPLDLVDRQRPPARHAPRREQVVDREPQAGLAVGRRAERRERGIEMPQVRRAEHDLGEQPGERAGLDGEGPALPIDGGTRDPAAPAVQVRHDVAGRRVRLQPGMHELRWRRRREPLIGRQREPGLGAGEEQPPDHRARLWQTDSVATLAR